MNVSYENSFNAIKKEVLKETVDKKKAEPLIPIEEKPNKPKEKLIVKNMNSNQQMNMTQDVKIAVNQSIHISTTPEEALNRTAA